MWLLVFGSRVGFCGVGFGLLVVGWYDTASCVSELLGWWFAIWGFLRFGYVVFPF